jgi:hypothetical protein
MPFHRQVCFFGRWIGKGSLGKLSDDALGMRFCQGAAAGDPGNILCTKIKKGYSETLFLLPFPLTKLPPAGYPLPERS